MATVDNETPTMGKENNIRNEIEVILGKKQLCKLLIFVEHQQNTQTESDVNLEQIVFCIACAEKYRINEVIREKTKVGLIELPKSQSPDRLLKQGDDIVLEIRGSVTLDPDIPSDAYTLTYLEGSDNYFRFPAGITDPDGRVTFVLRSGKDNQLLHTFFINVYELLALIGKQINSRQLPCCFDYTIRHELSLYLMFSIVDVNSISCAGKYLLDRPIFDVLFLC